MAEKFANFAESQLNGAYTTSDTSLDVDDASRFPAAGVFRVRLGSANPGVVFRVDSVSGNTFTGVAESDDANVADNEPVVLVGSQGAMEEIVQRGADIGIHGPTGPLGAHYRGPFWRTRPIVAAEYSWVNQGSATETVTGGIARLVVPSQTQNIRARMRTLTTGQTWTLHMLPLIKVNASAECGIIFRESGTDKWLALRLGDDGNLYVTDYTAANNISSNPAGPFGSYTPATQYARVPFLVGTWLRMQWSGSNIISSWSFDGVHWDVGGTQAQGTYFTTAPDQVGYFVNDRTNAVAQEMRVLSMLQT